MTKSPRKDIPKKDTPTFYGRGLVNDRQKPNAAARRATRMIARPSSTRCAAIQNSCDGGRDRDVDRPNSSTQIDEIDQSLGCCAWGALLLAPMHKPLLIRRMDRRR